MQRSLKELETRRGILAESLAADIGNGATTGNRYRNLVLREHGILDDEAEVRYCALEAMLRGKTGEFFAVLYPQIQNGPLEYHRHAHRRLIHSRIGILEGEQLIWARLNADGDMGYTLPISKYIQGWAVAKNQIPFFMNYPGAIDVGIFEAYEDEEIRPFASFMGFSKSADDRDRDRWETNFIIGDDAFSAWLRVLVRDDADRYFEAAAKALGRLVPA
jgi:hypothetical protein